MSSPEDTSSNAAASSSRSFATGYADSTPAFERWRLSISRFTGLGLSDDEKTDLDRDTEQMKKINDWEKCEKWKNQMMERSE